MGSTIYANIVTVQKMLSLIETWNKKSIPAKEKFALSAAGLTRFAKMTGVVGWESGRGKTSRDIIAEEVYKS